MRRLLLFTVLLALPAHLQGYITVLPASLLRRGLRASKNSGEEGTDNDDRDLLERSFRQKFKQQRRFIPYPDACLFARQFGFGSKEEWDEWIDKGEAYIPGFTRDPEPYYTRLGTWRGWGHFLGFDQDAVNNLPVTEEESDPDAGST